MRRASKFVCRRLAMEDVGLGSAPADSKPEKEELLVVVQGSAEKDLQDNGRNSKDKKNLKGTMDYKSSESH